MAESQDNSWRTQSFRQNVRGKIEEAIRQSGNPTTKSVAEMENHVFQKAKTKFVNDEQGEAARTWQLEIKPNFVIAFEAESPPSLKVSSQFRMFQKRYGGKEEYLGFVARLIIHVREMIDEDTDSDSSSSNNSSEIETYEDTIDDTDEEEDYEGTPNGAAGGQVQKNQGVQQKGVKRKRSEIEKDASSQELHQPTEKWNSQMNEWEAVGVNVFKKLQRMDPHQALYAESLITKVLRLGLLQSLTPETDVGLRPQQYVQDFAPSVSSLCNSLENHAATPMYVNTHQSVGNSTFSNTVQSVGNSTFSNTVPLSASFSAITTSSPAFVADHNAAVVDQSLAQNSLTLTTPNTVGEHQNTAQNNASSVIQSTVIAFKTEPGMTFKTEPGLGDSLS